MSRRITIDVSDAAETEIERLKAERGVSTADLFRQALSVYRLWPNALGELRTFARGHHGDQPAHVLLHALTVDIPAICDRLEKGEKS